MARLPEGYSLNGGLAFAGAPAHGNPAAAELVNPAVAQVRTATQQQASTEGTRAEIQAAQMAAAAKTMIQKAALAQNPNALQGLGAIAQNPGILENIGLA
jgi:hypothetical protein